MFYLFQIFVNVYFHGLVRPWKFIRRVFLSSNIEAKLFCLCRLLDIANLSVHLIYIEYLLYMQYRVTNMINVPFTLFHTLCFITGKHLIQTLFIPVKIKKIFWHPVVLQSKELLGAVLWVLIERVFVIPNLLTTLTFFVW